MQKFDAKGREIVKGRMAMDNISGVIIRLFNALVKLAIINCLTENIIELKKISILVQN